MRKLRWRKVPLVPMWIKAERWPWQDGYNWQGMVNSRAPLNMDGARFGAGWKWKLGMDIGGSSVIFNLLYGIVSVSFSEPLQVTHDRIAKQLDIHIGGMYKLKNGDIVKCTDGAADCFDFSDRVTRSRIGKQRWWTTDAMDIEEKIR